MALPFLQQIAVPETLLKKRKTSEKTREEKLAKATEDRKVGVLISSFDLAGSSVCTQAYARAPATSPPRHRTFT